MVITYLTVKINFSAYFLPVKCYLFVVMLRIKLSHVPLHIGCGLEHLYNQRKFYGLWCARYMIMKDRYSQLNLNSWNSTSWLYDCVTSLEYLVFFINYEWPFDFLYFVSPNILSAVPSTSHSSWSTQPSVCSEWALNKYRVFALRSQCLIITITGDLFGDSEWEVRCLPRVV